MLAPRIAHFERLLAQVERPGGAYPPLVLASHVEDEEERARIELRVDETPLAPLWRVFRDPSCTAVERATAFARFEPSRALPHWVVADLWLRRDDVRAEPFPEIHAAIRRLRPDLGAAYAALLARLTHDFDRESEAYVHRRGFGFSAEEASVLFADVDERACFARACLAWGARPAFVEDVLPASELAELAIRHTRGGASADLHTALFAALECADVLTSLRLFGPGIATALRAITRAPNLITLALPGTELAGTPAEGVGLASLALASLDIVSDARAACPVPAWMGSLASLRVLSLGYTVKGVDDAAVDLADARFDLPALTTLRLSGVGRLPATIGCLTHLRSLTVRGRHLASVPESLGELAALESLSIDPVLALPALPASFERLRALRTLRLGHLAEPALPRALFAMPWLRRVDLVSGRVIGSEAEAELRRALPDTSISIAFTGNAR